MTQNFQAFEGWSTYPRSLCLSAAEADANGYDRRLARAEKLLFINEEEDDEIDVQVLELGSVHGG